MKIDITLQKTISDKKMYQHVERRVRMALCRFGATIQAVNICITDTNGPKGGIDTRCVVLVKFTSNGEVVVQGKGYDIFSVLNHCLSRTARTIGRNLERRRETPIRINRRRAVFEDKEKEYQM